MASLNVMSYAEIVFAIVPEALPAWKKCRATSWPAPISAKVPYWASLRLIVSALRLVVSRFFCSLMTVNIGARRRRTQLVRGAGGDG
jgi:hypothetical protein